MGSRKVKNERQTWKNGRRAGERRKGEKRKAKIDKYCPEHKQSSMSLLKTYKKIYVCVYR